MLEVEGEYSWWRLPLSVEESVEEDQLSRNLWKKINQSFRGIVPEICCEIMKINED